MIKFYFIICAVVISLATGASASSDLSYDDALELSVSDPAAAVAALHLLAKSGNVKAQDRLGYHYRMGLGTPQDLVLARDWYVKASKAGRKYSLSSLARVEIALGQGDAAHAALSQAIEQEVPGARRQMAFAHVDGKLGAHSDAQFGLSALVSLAQSGDAKVARPLLSRYTWNRLRAPAPDLIVNQTLQQALDGDAKAAEAALVYVSHNWPVSDAQIELRQRLLRISGVRAKFSAPAQIEIIAQTKGDQFWTLSEAILDSVDNDAFEKTAVTTFNINKNALYRVFQKRLNSLGYRAGPVDGTLGVQTLRAMTQFCKANNIWHICAHGPARTSTIRAIAAKLSEDEAI